MLRRAANVFRSDGFPCGGLGAMTRFLDKAMSPRLRTESSIISPVFVINLVGSIPKMAH